VILVKYKEGLPNTSGDSQDFRYLSSGTGAVATTVQAKLRQYVSVKDFGAIGDGTTDDTAAIQAAFTNAPLGCTLYFPVGTYKVTPATSTYCLNLSRNINLQGSQGGKSLIRADNTTSTCNIISVAITDNGGFGDVRNQKIDGLSAYFTTTGKHALFIDQGTVGPIGMDITNNQFSAGSYGKAIYFNAVSQFSSVMFNQIENGIEFAGASGDGQRICFNEIFGTNTGIVFNTGNGTYSHLIMSNSITCQNGAIYIPYSAQVKICYNQMEQVGLNSYGYQSLVAIDAGYGIDIIGNNFGGGTNVLQNATINGASSCVFRDNVFTRSAGYDINFTSASANCVVDYNRFNGNRSGLNPNWAAVIADAGTNNVYPGIAAEFVQQTYTPVVSLAGASSTVAYSTQQGQYTRIGDTVSFTATIVTSTWTHSATTAGLLISLPIAPVSTTRQFVGLSGGVNYTKTNYTQIVPTIDTSAFAANVYFAAYGSGQAIDAVAASNVPSGTNLTIVVSGSYKVYG
jgi:hypothetical protein